MASRLSTKNRVLTALLVLGLTGSTITAYQLYHVRAFNRAIVAGQSPVGESRRYEAKFSSAWRLANEGRYLDATQLFNQLLEADHDAERQSAVQYNLGNIFFRRGLMVHRNGGEVRDEALYLMIQARIAYQQSLRLDPGRMDARYNLDRVLRTLPQDTRPNEKEDQLGIVMGNIPTGLP